MILFLNTTIKDTYAVTLYDTYTNEQCMMITLYDRYIHIQCT